jgi:amidophosphoribosyltransferase
MPLPLSDDDKFHEECGVFGVWRHKDAAALTALGLHALQHRGQEASGIVTLDDAGSFHTHKGLGLVGDIFGDAKVMASLPGSTAIGHNRYATTGETALRNVQPLYADFEFGGFAVGHNGNLTNAGVLKRALVRRGCLFQSSTDSEVFVHLIAISLYSTVLDRLIDALKQVQGAYSLVALHNGGLIGARDPLGVRPLVLGRLNDGWVLASETCALDIVSAEFVRDIEPGEIVVIDDSGIRSVKPFSNTENRFCIFEYIYFARPDSVMEGTPVYDTRKRIGAELARESGVEADVVVPVPDSGVPAAMGYAVESGIPFELGIIRNHYVGRTFIEPTDQIRHLGVKLKHSANRAVLEGKRVILVDDSIVRGTTSKKIVEMVRQAGAA